MDEGTWGAMSGDAEGRARASLLANGQRAAETLARSVAQKPAEMPIETNVGSLRGLSEVIGALVAETNRCGGIDCMGRSVDGTKTWVTRDRLDAVSQRAARLEEALRTIARAASEAGGGEMDMLVDWQGTVRALGTVAHRALAEDSAS